MMNSNNTKTILDKVLKSIDPVNLYNKIDKPLDQCLQSFSYMLPDIITHQDFNEIIGIFYQYLSRDGAKFRTEVNYSEALEEVSWLLEKYYQGYETRGYDGAYFDACSEDNERIYFILERIVEILKSLVRKKFISWLINSNIDPLDWNLKVQIVKDILENNGHLLHPDVKRLSVAQFAPYLEELISLLADTALPPSSPF